MDSEKTFTFDYQPCPVCGNTEYTQGKNQKTLYRCTRVDLHGNRCPGVVYECKNCNKVYPERGFGFHSDAYECKECGKVQWDLTDIKKTLAALRGMGSALDNVIRNTRY